MPSPQRTFRAPGRVNLIGDHTGGNEGLALPFAIDLEIRVTATAREDKTVRAHSLATRSSAEFRLDGAPATGTTKDWIDYVRGIAGVLAESGHILGGADLLVESTLPMRAGLASSAALTVATGWALIALSGGSIDRSGLAKAARLAETRFADGRCGLTDVYAPVFGLRDHALLLDGRNADADLVPVPTQAAAFIVCDTRERLPTADDLMEERWADCDEALRTLRRGHPGIRSLRDVDAGDLARALLPAAPFRRARHVVTENARVLAAAEALRSGSLAQAGWLMRQSHESLRLDYEASTEKLDALVAMAAEIPGVYGSRVMGDGFGGSTIHLADPACVERFQSVIEARYRDAFREPLDVRVVYPSDGAGEVEYPDA